MFGLGNEEVLKGNPPTMKSFKEEQKKRSLKIRIRDFCQDYHWSRGDQLSQILDEDGDGYVKPTFKLFIYNLWRKFLDKIRIYYYIKALCQKIFRKNHLTGVEIWDAKSSLTRYCLKVVKAYKEMERSGYPGIFSEYEENAWKTREEYDAKIASGEMIGGGAEAWEKILDHIIMALEYVSVEGSFKRQSEWFLKYFGMDPYEKDNKVNEDIHYSYKEFPAPYKHYGSSSSSTQPDLDKVEWCTKETHYMNSELIFYAERIVQDGYCLLGQFMQAMWD